MNFGHKDLKDAEVQSYFTTMKKSNTYQNRLETANILGMAHFIRREDVWKKLWVFGWSMIIY